MPLCYQHNNINTLYSIAIKRPGSALASPGRGAQADSVPSFAALPDGSTDSTGQRTAHAGQQDGPDGAHRAAQRATGTEGRTGGRCCPLPMVCPGRCTANAVAVPRIDRRAAPGQSKAPGRCRGRLLFFGCMIWRGGGFIAGCISHYVHWFTVQGIT